MAWESLWVRYDQGLSSYKILATWQVLHTETKANVTALREGSSAYSRRRHPSQVHTAHYSGCGLQHTEYPGGPFLCGSATGTQLFTPPNDLCTCCKVMHCHLPSICCSVMQLAEHHQMWGLKMISLAKFLQERVRGERYDALVDEVVTCLRKRYGPSLVLHWEDFAASNAFRLLGKYRARVSPFEHS